MEQLSSRVCELDTLVVPGSEEGFQRVFLGENRWWAVRIAPTRAEHLKYIAIYRIAPISAITHYARILSFEPRSDPRKSIITLAGHATPIGPIPLVKGDIVSIQSPRYTTFAKLQKAANLRGVF